MEIAKLQVTGAKARVVSRGPLPAGLIGGYITIHYADPKWRDLTKTVVFRGAVTIDVVTGNDTVLIPPETVAVPGKRLYVGFYGTKADNTLAIPTFWADLGTVMEAADPSGDESTAPSLPVWAQITERVEELESDIADLKYVPISITSLSNSAGTKEMGQVVTEVTVSWTLNKNPVSQTLAGETVAPDKRSMTVTGLNVTGDMTAVLKVTDERGATAEKSTKVTFLNGAYYGAAAQPETLYSGFVLSLNKVLTDKRNRSFTVNAGEGQYIWYCIPKRMGECTFKVGGFEGGFDLISTMAFTNASGYTEDYYIYRSTNAALGSTSVEVS